MTRILTRTGLSPAVAGLSRPFRFDSLPMSWSYYPKDASTPLVWAPPRSLATTCGITVVFFSWR